MARLESQSAFPVAGKLEHFHDLWACMMQDQWIVDAIQGYRIQFSKYLVQAFPPRVGVTPTCEQSLMQEKIHAM